MILGTGIIGSPKKAEIVWHYAGHNNNDDPPWNFNNVPLGPDHPTRKILVAAVPAGTFGTGAIPYVITVGGVAAAYLGGVWYIVDYPSGTNVQVRIAHPTSTDVHGSVEVWSVYHLKSATPVGGPVSVLPANNGAKSLTINAVKGGVVAAYCNGGGLGAGLMQWTFSGGASTDHAGAVAENNSIGAGSGQVLANNAALSVTATRTTGNASWSMQGISFR